MQRYYLDEERDLEEPAFWRGVLGWLGIGAAFFLSGLAAGWLIWG